MLMFYDQSIKKEKKTSYKTLLLDGNSSLEHDGKHKDLLQKQPLATIAVAKQLALQRFQIVVLRDTLASYADSNGMVDKHFFDQALKRAKMTSTEDKEIFDLLFTMWDSEGEEEIPHKPFSVLGVSPLACPNDDVVSILRFALYISDENSTGVITAKGLHDLLGSKLVIKTPGCRSLWNRIGLNHHAASCRITSTFSNRYCYHCILLWRCPAADF
jgi:hypothetical protein